MSSPNAGNKRKTPQEPAYVPTQEIAPEDQSENELAGESCPPIHLKQCFNPAELCGCDPKGYVGMLTSLCSTLPIQMHVEPKGMDDAAAPPLFTRTVSLLRSKPELRELVDVERARVKIRLSGKGKFIHRNRYRRRNIICCLSGQQRWLFIKSAARDSEGNSLADAYLHSTSNKNWNGYRSQSHPSMLTQDEMQKIASEQPPECEATMLLLEAGDIMTFDGRWWHGTQYNAPVLNLFFTPGKDMEVAVKEHHRRMAMPFQQGLKIATINAAKCSKLSGNWTEGKGGDKIAWTDLHKAEQEKKVEEDTDYY